MIIVFWKLVSSTFFPLYVRIKTYNFFANRLENNNSQTFDTRLPDKKNKTILNEDEKLHDCVLYFWVIQWTYVCTIYNWVKKKYYAERQYS